MYGNSELFLIDNFIRTVTSYLKLHVILAGFLAKITCNFSKESIHFAPLLKLHVILTENLFFKFNLNAIHVFKLISLYLLQLRFVSLSFV